MDCVFHEVLRNWIIIYNLDKKSVPKGFNMMLSPSTLNKKVRKWFWTCSAWTKVGYSETFVSWNQGVGQEGCLYIRHSYLSEYSGRLRDTNKCFKMSTGNFPLQQRHTTDMVHVKLRFVLFVFITRVTLTHLCREMDDTCHPRSHLWIA